MNEERAREILGDAISDDNSLQPTYGDAGDKGTSFGYMSWCPGDGDDITLDAHFRADVLEAIAWWMRNKNG